jgi:putative glycosyltransferase
LGLKKNTLSIVTTTYNSENEIKEFATRCLNSCSKVNLKLQNLIIVDDGSTDGTVSTIKNILKKFPMITLIQLSKNYGQHEAIITGLEVADSDFIFLIDSDLEESPEDLEKLFHELANSNVDVVYGVQSLRRGGIFEKLEGSFFYGIILKLLDLKIPVNALTSRLMTREYVKAVISYPEKRIYLGGVFNHVGFKQKSVKLEKLRIGKSRYSFRKKIFLTLKLITSFSTKPLVFFAFVAFSQLLVSTILVISLIINFLLTNESVSGWYSLIVSIWFTTGLLSLMLSILMLYVSELMLEVKNRPRTIVREQDS